MLNYEFPPLGGGSGNATYELLREFSNYPGLHVDLVTSSVGGQQEVVEFSPSIRVFKLPVGKAQTHYWTMSEILRWFVRARRCARELCADTAYDLCHCWSGWPAGVIGYTLRNELPYLVALRGSDVPGYNVRLRYIDQTVFRPLSRMVWRSAAAITSVSGDLARLAERTMPDIAPAIIGNGVDTAKFKPNGTSDQFTILFVGRLIPRKGLSYLIRAFATLAEDYPQCELILVGGGPEERNLHDLCRRHGIGDRVKLSGSVDHDALAPMYASASIFVMPALEEAMSNAVLEAMASGLPIVTTNSGVFELLDENGIVVEKQDHRQLELALRRYLEDPELVRRHGSRSRQLAERYTWANKASAYLDLYKDIQARGGADKAGP